ncbi:hypothetical protein [Paraburkholderia sp. BCC1886]|uniref:hypothetical protein n=1 Tax=Paraburkholderia sp. BCC1886 TaxID=2562670 RepID=UPI00118408B5|nr:hypothetical protein [Paraburkholderia sp. BCC1886]
MCYGKPDELTAQLLEACGLKKNDLGHTALDDFDHFCAYSGCIKEEIGELAFAWTKYAYLSAHPLVR